MNAAESTYGSDENGFVWGYWFRPGQAAEPIDASTAASRLAEQGAVAREGFLWLHFSLANAASMRWLQQYATLPDTFLHELRSGHGSTRIEQDGDALIAVMRDVLFDFRFDPADVSTVSLCVLPDLLVSARLKPLRSIEQLRAAVKTGEIFRSPAELLAHLMRDQANVLVDILRQSSHRVDAIEDDMLQNRISISRAELGVLRRVLVRLQRLLAPEPAALFRLLNRPPAWIHPDDLQDLQQSAEEFSTTIADSVALVERLKLIQEELGALVNEQNNRSLFVLTVVTVLALPINMIAGLLGMNVGGIPFAGDADGFWVIIAIVSVLTCTLGVWAFRRRE
ncbi:MAG TPA: transporter [Pseudomonadales bacterium]|nr:transporter [Pseudomonadales bacterium]